MENIQYLKPSLQMRQKRRDKRLDEELIECYRRGSRSKKMKGYANKFVRNDYEHALSRESIKLMHAGGTKYFNDNLSPLRRLLERRVGKNWNKIKSELCSQLDKSTVSGLHVFNHLYDFVIENTFIENGIVYHLQFGKQQPVVSREKWPKFYIHEVTGQLMKAPDERTIRQKLRRLKNERRMRGINKVCN